MLVVMAGLPACGKSAIAEALAREIGVPVVAIDPIEAALLLAAHPAPTTAIGPTATIGPTMSIGPTGYIVAEAVADGVLALGQSVIVDAVNAVEPAREQWRGLARRRAAKLTFVEVLCSDRAEHRRRLETRVRGIEGYPEPTWQAVERLRGEFESWTRTDERLVLDSVDDIAANVARVRERLAV